MQSHYFLLLFLLHTFSLASSAVPENMTLNCSAEEGQIQGYKNGELLPIAIHINMFEYLSSIISGAHEEKERISHIYTVVISKNKATLADSHSC